ncbi:hypothetical protein MYX07_00220 [Patescibacteria group bacterium AH-259-L07]|nr:hypothetical protein [Patescibacteria group bacterium AH-259-L07]
MRGIITKIDQLKKSFNNDDTCFYRLYFKLESGSWAKTDAVPGFRNFARWKPVIEGGPGTALNDLVLLDENTVDADCYPEIITEPKQIELFDYEQISKTKHTALSEA